MILVHLWRNPCVFVFKTAPHQTGLQVFSLHTVPDTIVGEKGALVKTSKIRNIHCLGVVFVCRKLIYDSLESVYVLKRGF